MKTGRNDPCPCGSGRKYKHCCLMSSRVAAADMPEDLMWRRLRHRLQEFQRDILRFIDHSYGPAALAEGWMLFTGASEGPDPDKPFMQAFMPWFFHRWSPDPEITNVDNQSLHGVVPTRAYLDKKGRHVDSLLRRYLESCLVAPFSFYEVRGCVPEHSIRLRDVMTGAEHDVSERALSAKLQVGDLFFGQLAFVDRLVMIEAFGGYPLPLIEKAALVELRRELTSEHGSITPDLLREHELDLLDVFHEITERTFDQRVPELRNTDDEPFSLQMLVFDLHVTPQAAFDALKHLSVVESEESMLAAAKRDRAGQLRAATITWHKLGNKAHPEWTNTVMGTLKIDGNRLTAEVNSDARAQRARALIEQALGTGVHYRATRHQSIEKALADMREHGTGADDEAAREQERLNALPEVRARLAEMAAAHMERWVDLPLPVLEGRTPREAVQDADGREVVESLLLEFERRGQALNPPTDAALFRRLRERLGLAAPGSI